MQLIPAVSAAALALTLLQCQSKSPEPRAGEPAAANAAEGAAAAQSYGAPLTPQAPISLADLVRTPKEHAGQTVLVEGVVRRACSAKGCWMELATSGENELPGCRVTFKDYGFFIPTDSAGSVAKVQGVVEVTQVKKSHVEHLEGEGATFEAKNDDGTATEVRIVATGVELSRT